MKSIRAYLLLFMLFAGELEVKVNQLSAETGEVNRMHIPAQALLIGLVIREKMMPNQQKLCRCRPFCQPQQGSRVTSPLELCRLLEIIFSIVNPTFPNLRAAEGAGSLTYNSTR